MSQNGPFGIDPEDLDRVMREAGDGLRDALGRIGKQAGWATLLDEFTKGTRPKTEPETTGETGDGVWSIYTVDDDGRRPHRRGVPDRAGRVARQQEQHRPGPQGAVPAVRHRGQRARRAE